MSTGDGEQRKTEVGLRQERKLLFERNDGLRNHERRGGYVPFYFGVHTLVQRMHITKRDER